MEYPAVLSRLDLGVFLTALIPDLTTLRQLLSEPNEPKVPLTYQVIADRVKQGSWTDEPATQSLLSRIVEIPGLLLLGEAASLLDDRAKIPHCVGPALERLRDSRHSPVGRMAADLAVLMTASLLGPRVSLPNGTVDLSEILPDLVVKLVRLYADWPSPEASSPSNSMPIQEGTPKLDLTDAEPAILRTCAELVARLERRSIEILSAPQRFWLTWRTYGWFLDVIGENSEWEDIIAAAPPRKTPTSNQEAHVLDPSRFGPHHYAIRLAVLLWCLQALPDALHNSLTEDEQKKLTPLPLVSDALITLLVDLTARPLRPEELEIRHLSANLSELGWGPLVAVPDLALSLLLRLDPKSVLQLPAEIRHLRLSEVLEARPDSGLGDLLPLLLVTLGQHISSLSDAERVHLALLVEDGHPHLSARWRWTLGMLLARAGDTHLEEHVRSLLADHPEDPDLLEALSVWMALVAEENPSELRGFIERLGEEPSSLSPSQRILLLGRTASTGDEGARTARALIRELMGALDNPADPEVARLLAVLGLSVRS